jgi:predicted nucleotidyltransferase
MTAHFVAQPGVDYTLEVMNTGELNFFDIGFYNTDLTTEVAFDPPFVDIVAGLTGVASSSAAWGDYDNDGDLDILLTGDEGSGSNISRVYRNDGGSFVDIVAGLTGVASSSAAWGDYDNDGDLDILLTGWGASGYISRVYRNDGGSFVDIVAGLPDVDFSSVAWGDYDNDGDLDILLTGYNGSEYISCVYRNDDGTFTDIGAGLTGVSQSSVAWGDYDNDGDLDILLTGDGGDTPVSHVYRNDNGTFTDIGAGLTGVFQSSVAWGDYDNDGDLDILLTGSDILLTGSGYISRVYRNDGGSFVDVVAGLTGVRGGAVAWGDCNNDGDLDILLTGWGASGYISHVYRNDGGSFVDIAAELTRSTPSIKRFIKKPRN